MRIHKLLWHPTPNHMFRASQFRTVCENIRAYHTVPAIIQSQTLSNAVDAG